jgi:hypothetical protein
MSSHWYIYKDGQKHGPFSFDQLMEAAHSGKLRPEDMVWGSGMDNWTRAIEVEGLNPPAWQHSTAPAPTHAPAAAIRQGHGQAAHAKLEQLSKWMGFVGIMTIIGGAISAISGVFAFVVGAIPGIITILLGVMLRKAKGNAENMLYEDPVDSYSANFSMLIANLNSYFKILGILIIISLVLGVLMVILGIIAGSFITNFLGELINL